jgi:hypothetical protein
VSVIKVGMIEALSVLRITFPACEGMSVEELNAWGLERWRSLGI